MNSKAIKLTIFALALSLLTGCSTYRTAQDRERDRRNVVKELGSEMSLKADRERLNDMRKEVPAETQKSNDELALFLSLIPQGNENPQVVRDKFNYMVQKKRTAFRDKVQKLREDFRNDETKRREDFLSAQKTRREGYKAKRLDAKGTRDLYAAQEKDRLAFTADERARRQNFESELNAQSKDFDSYMRERQREFDEQYRLYAKKTSEKPKDAKAATGEEFKRMNETPATSLGTGD